MAEYTKVRSPYNGGTWTNPGMIALVATYCAIKGIKLSQFPVMQGSFNTGVAASVGTHDRADCIDARADVDWRLLKTIGAFAWPRTRAQGFTPHVHFGRMYSTAMAWLATAQDKAYRARKANGLGNLTHTDTTWTPRYRAIRHLSGPEDTQLIAKRKTYGYTQPGSDPIHDMDLIKQTRATGYVLSNIAGKVRCQSKDYWVTTSGTFYLASDFGIKPVVLPPEWFTITEWNLAGFDVIKGKRTWDKRLQQMIDYIEAIDSDIYCLIEIPDGKVAAFRSKLAGIGYKIVTGTDGRYIVVRRSIKTGRTFNYTLPEKGPKKDDKQAVYAEVWPDGDNAVLIECSQLEYRKGAAYDRARVNQGVQTRHKGRALAAEWDIHPTRVFYCDDENSETWVLDKAYEPTYVDALSVAADPINETTATLCGWSGKTRLGDRIDKIKAHKDRPIRRARVHTGHPGYSDHLPTTVTVGRK